MMNSALLYIPKLLTGAWLTLQPSAIYATAEMQAMLTNATVAPINP